METTPGERAATLDDLVALNDSALLNWRAQARAELERLPPHSPAHAALVVIYDGSTIEIDARARAAWTSWAAAHRTTTTATTAGADQ